MPRYRDRYLRTLSLSPTYRWEYGTQSSMHAYEPDRVVSKLAVAQITRKLGFHGGLAVNKGLKSTFFAPNPATTAEQSAGGFGQKPRESSSLRVIP